MLITAFYTGLLALLFTAISFRVMSYRGNGKIPIGDGGDNQMLRYMRGHANFVEYVPLILLMMALAEYRGEAAWLLHVCGTSLLAGRLLHGYAFMVAKFNMPARVAGMLLTLIPLLVLTASLLIRSSAELFS